MFKWPMKAATCIGVRPDCGQSRQRYSRAPAPPRSAWAGGERAGGSGWHVYLCDSLDGGTAFHQQLHDFDAVFLAGNVQWGETVLRKRQPG